MNYVNVVIDNNTDKTDRFYTYGCSFPQVRPGDRVLVPFAQGDRIRPAYVFEVMDHLEKDIPGLKMVREIDSEYSLPEEALEICLWMKKRYLCRLIEGIHCFTPSGTISKGGKARRPYRDAEGLGGPVESLTLQQELALARIYEKMDSGRQHSFLLHGVTSSGKTEVYMRAIERALEKGKTAIMLVPEISLTPEIIRRFISRFTEEKIAVLHSRLSMGERYDEWTRIRKGEVSIVIGARSAVFAPLENIGVIVMDEEHELTYKSDKSPKYDTGEVALRRAMVNKGVLIVGSATPSIVTAVRAEEGFYEKLTLTERYNGNQMPQVEIQDMREELKNGNTSVFSTRLFSLMDETLKQDKQIILFLNRRGYSTFLSCRECGFVMKCRECGISMTYHKEEGNVRCHYCGRNESLPTGCPSCGSRYLRHFGSGTEKVEEQVNQYFPHIPAARLDLDSTKKKGSLDKILSDFRKGRTRILIGTQIVAKGLDFHHVGLVGILAADTTLNIPDYRSAERTFQLITQAAGRTGRGETRGRVVIQTYEPEHYAVTLGARQDYDGFYQVEKEIREGLKYPPFADILLLTVSGKKEKDSLEKAESVYKECMAAFGNSPEYTVFRPAAAVIAKQGNLFRHQIVMKVDRGRRKEYAVVLEKIKRDYGIIIDINPASMM